MSHSESYNLYSEMGIGTILSRAWRLYRLNFRSVILYSLIPAVLITVASIIFNSPAGLSKNNNIISTVICCVFPFGCLFYIVGIYISIFFNLGLIKAFSNILIGKPHKYTYVFESIKNNIVHALLLSFIFIAEFIFFTLINFFLVSIGYILIILSFFPLAFVKNSNSSEQFVLIYCIGAVIIIAIAIFLFFSIVVLEFLLVAMQFIVFTIEKTTIPRTIIRSFQLITKKTTKLILFGLCLGAIQTIFTMYFQYPIIIAIVSGLMTFENFPKEVFMTIFTITVNLWSNIVNLLLWPFLISSLVVFYYDILIKTEGLDLKLLLAEEKNKITSTEAEKI